MYKEQCPYCNQDIHGLVKAEDLVREKVTLTLDIEAEIYSALESNTTFGRNQLKEILAVIFDRNVREI